MPSPAHETLQPPSGGNIRVALEPVYNILYSLMLMVKVDKKSGLGNWLMQAKEKLSLEERQRHHLIFDGLWYLILPEAGWQSFIGYLDDLAKQDPDALQKRLFKAYENRLNCCIDFDSLSERSFKHTPDAAASSGALYQDYLKERFDVIDEDLEARAYHALTNLPETVPAAVEYMRGLWERMVSAEWTRCRPMLEEAIRAFETLGSASLDKKEAFKVITGQEPSQSMEYILAHTDEVVFIPNAHIGPYIGKIIQGRTAYILFGARLPAGSQIQVPDLSRNEIVTRLNALSDEVRLRILRLVAEKGELRSQDIMVQLDLSQSTTSRHLTQLTATGYLQESRIESAKCYRLNPGQIENTLNAIAAYLQIRPGSPTA